MESGKCILRILEAIWFSTDWPTSFTSRNVFHLIDNPDATISNHENHLNTRFFHVMNRSLLLLTRAAREQGLTIWWALFPSSLNRLNKDTLKWKCKMNWCSPIDIQESKYLLWEQSHIRFAFWWDFVQFRPSSKATSTVIEGLSISNSTRQMNKMKLQPFQNHTTLKPIRDETFWTWSKPWNWPAMGSNKPSHEEHCGKKRTHFLNLNGDGMTYHTMVLEYAPLIRWSWFHDGSMKMSFFHFA